MNKKRRLSLKAFQKKLIQVATPRPDKGAPDKADRWTSDRDNKGHFKDRLYTAENRVLLIMVQKCCKDFQNLADDLSVSRQYLAEWTKKEVPLQYASFLARANGFHPALLNYKYYVLMGGIRPFTELLKACSFFSKEDRHYILEGKHITNIDQYLTSFDEDFWHDS